MPSITFVTDAETIEQNDAVVFEIRSAIPLDHAIYVRHKSGLGLYEMVAIGEGTVPASSLVEHLLILSEPIVEEETTVGWRYTLSDPHAQGWRSDIEVRVSAYDTDGSFANASSNFDIDRTSTNTTIANYDPESESTIDPTDSITFDVVNFKDVRFVAILAGYVIEGLTVESYELVGAKFGGDDYEASAGYVLESHGVDVGDRITISKVGGWDRRFRLTAVGADAGFPDVGIAAEAFGSAGAFYDVQNATPLDVENPVTTVVSPTAGETITATTPIVIDVTDDSGRFRRVLVAVFFSGLGKTLLVHDGDSFLGGFAISSTREMIDGGYRYTVVSDAGWEASPTIRVFTFDQSGKEG